MATPTSVNANELNAFLALVPEQMLAARKSAIGQTVTFTRRQLRVRLARTLQTPEKVWQRYRVRVTRKPDTGTVWIGFNDVKAVYTGSIRQGPHGAYAGLRYFPGAFIATMRSGHTGIFERVGTRVRRGGRWFAPIEEITVNVDLGITVADAVARDATQELRRLFIDKILKANPHLTSQ